MLLRDRCGLHGRSELRPRRPRVRHVPLEMPHRRRLQRTLRSVVRRGWSSPLRRRHRSVRRLREEHGLRKGVLRPCGPRLRRVPDGRPLCGKAVRPCVHQGQLRVRRRRRMLGRQGVRDPFAGHPREVRQTVRRSIRLLVCVRADLRGGRTLPGLQGQRRLRGRQSLRARRPVPRVPRRRRLRRATRGRNLSARPYVWMQREQRLHGERSRAHVPLHEGKRDLRLRGPRRLRARQELCSPPEHSLRSLPVAPSAPTERFVGEQLQLEITVRARQIGARRKRRPATSLTRSNSAARLRAASPRPSLHTVASRLREFEGGCARSMPNIGGSVMRHGVRMGEPPEAPR